MGDLDQRQGEGDHDRANPAASDDDFSAQTQPPSLPLPDPKDPFWASCGFPEDMEFDTPPEGPGATFAFADFNPDTDQMVILADPDISQLSAVTTLSAPNAPITLLRLDFKWAHPPQTPGYQLTVMVSGQHSFSLNDLHQIAPPKPCAKPAEWIHHHPTDADTITIAAFGFIGPLHLVEVSQIYDKDRASPTGRFVEHTSRFYIYAAPDLDPAAILAPFADEDWGLLAQLSGVAKVFEVTLPPRDISPETDLARSYPMFITDRDPASKQSLNYHY